MSIRLSGREVALHLYDKLQQKVAVMKERGIQPEMAIIRVGEKSSDISYETGVKKNAEKTGISVRSIVLPEQVTEEALLTEIRNLNEDNGIHGILLFLPLPKHLDESKIVNAIDPKKDLDGVTDASRLGVYTDSGVGFAPCTPSAVMEILHDYQIPIKGKRVVIVGRSLVVGKPLAMMLLKEHATVTICHSRTERLHEHTKEADILICATGHIGTLDASHVRPGQTVIDVGINFTEEGKMTGDIVYPEISNIVDAVTPVPGGVGAVTTSVLLSHVLAFEEDS